MMRLSSTTFVLVLAFTVQSVAVPPSHALHEKREAAFSRWVKREKVPSSQHLPMRIGLKQKNLHRGYEVLMDVSHPESPGFAKHWTTEEVIEMFAPAEETVEAVRQWLVDYGISSHSIKHTDNQGWLAFDAAAGDVEALLHAEYHLYEHSSMGHVSIGCDSYHVPKHIQEHVDYITPGIRLLSSTKRGHRKRSHRTSGHRGSQFIQSDAPVAPGAMSAAGPLANCDSQITPVCIRALYGVPEVPEYPNGTPRTDNSMGLFEEYDTYAQQDLDDFFTSVSPHIPNGTHPVPAFVDGAQAPTTLGNAGGESNLDMQLAYPLIYPQGLTLYQTDDFYYSETTSGFFNTFLDAIDGSYCTYSAYGETGNDPALDPVYPDPRQGGYKGQLQCGVYKPTNVISVSYGMQEYDLPAYYQQRQCAEYMKLGLQGVSIIFASGDDGVAGPPPDIDPFGPGTANGCLGSDAKVFSPAFPNNCPYVTNVGATKITPGTTVNDPESAVVDPAGQPWSRAFSSGGGFSNIFPQPDYQASAVASFFENHNPPYSYYEGNGLPDGKDGGVYNRLGRGYPDVAANGDNILEFIGGYHALSGGTSASTPIFASLINRINEIRLNAGKNTLGFLNPVLYANPGIFNDITNGSNPGCGTIGFSAVPGWDPVSGLGTPNYPKMRDVLTALP